MCEFVNNLIICSDIFCGNMANILFAWSLFKSESKVIEDYNISQSDKITCGPTETVKIGNEYIIKEYGTNRKIHVSKETHEQNEKFIKYDKDKSNVIATARKLKLIASIAFILVLYNLVFSVHQRLPIFCDFLETTIIFLLLGAIIIIILNAITNKLFFVKEVKKPQEIIDYEKKYCTAEVHTNLDDLAI